MLKSAAQFKSSVFYSEQQGLLGALNFSCARVQTEGQVCCQNYNNLFYRNRLIFKQFLSDLGNADSVQLLWKRALWKLLHITLPT